MKKLQLKFAAQQLSKQQMKQVIGGGPSYATTQCYWDYSYSVYLGPADTGMVESDCLAYADLNQICKNAYIGNSMAVSDGDCNGINSGHM